MKLQRQKSNSATATPPRGPSCCTDRVRETTAAEARTCCICTSDGQCTYLRTPAGAGLTGVRGAAIARGDGATGCCGALPPPSTTSSNLRCGVFSTTLLTCEVQHGGGQQQVGAWCELTLTFGCFQVTVLLPSGVHFGHVCCEQDHGCALSCRLANVYLGGEVEGGECVAGVEGGGRDVTEHERLCIAAQRVLQQHCQLRVPVNRERSSRG